MMIAGDAETGERPAAVIGRVAASRRQRLARIRLAAREVFAEKGFDAASMREIAARARVAIGTLYSVASDKRELCMMVVEDDMEAFYDTPLSQPLSAAGTIDRLLAFFAPRFEYWARHPQLYRSALAIGFECLILSRVSNPIGDRSRQRIDRTLLKLTSLIDQEQAAGRIRPDRETERIAYLLWSIYTVHLRHHLGQNGGDLECGMAELGRLFELALCGLARNDRP